VAAGRPDRETAACHAALRRYTRAVLWSTPSFYGRDGRWRELPPRHAKRLGPDERSAYACGAYAADAADHARTAGLALDYTPASVRQMERMLAMLHDSLPPGIDIPAPGVYSSDPALLRLAKSYGGYLGEVLRLHDGARWSAQSVLGPENGEFNLRLADGSEVWPIAKVYKRLAYGPEDNVWLYYLGLTGRSAEPAGPAGE
jgi:hypothetical protein